MGAGTEGSALLLKAVNILIELFQYCRIGWCRMMCVVQSDERPLRCRWSTRSRRAVVQASVFLKTPSPAYTKQGLSSGRVLEAYSRNLYAGRRLWCEVACTGVEERVHLDVKTSVIVCSTSSARQVRPRLASPRQWECTWHTYLFPTYRRCTVHLLNWWGSSSFYHMGLIAL